MKISNKTQEIIENIRSNKVPKIAYSDFCSICDEDIVRIKDTRNKTVRYFDENLNLWQGWKCPSCKPNKLQKAIKANRYCKINVNECIECSKIFVSKGRKAKVCSDKCRRNELNKRTGYYTEYRQTEEYKQKQRIKNREIYKKKKVCKIFPKNCQVCNKAYVAKRSNSKFCSSHCHKKSLKYKNICKQCNKEFTFKTKKKYCSQKCIKSSKLIGKHTKIKYLTCPICNKVIVLRNVNKKYCNTKCQRISYNLKYPEKRKGRKRLRRRAKKERKLSCVSWSEIEQIYNNTPENHHVDHIIPLNHDNVSGLHVPWNLQYLTQSDNLLKSDKFDGSQENKSWKTNIKAN